jgi:1-deoxy-D-xylulose-5-phosphate synthase
VALQNLPVIFCLDRAGLVGEDGATHHGVFDIAYLRTIPNMIIYAPINEIALQNILYTAQLGLNHPIAIRYPRGRGVLPNWEVENFGQYEKIIIGQASVLKTGTKTAVLSTGTIGNNVTLAINELSNPETIAHYDFPFIKPLDIKLLNTILSSFEKVITIEDGVINGGFGSAVLEFAAAHNYKNNIEILGIPDVFIEHGTVNQLQQLCNIDVKSLVNLFSNATK